jgi:hypothetical protein
MLVGMNGSGKDLRKKNDKERIFDRNKKFEKLRKVLWTMMQS